MVPWLPDRSDDRSAPAANEDVSNQQNSSTPLSETTNVSCYHWGLSKGACSLWRMTGQLNISFRSDGEWSTHEKQKFSAHSTHGYSLWKRLFVIWKTTGMFLTEKYTIITLQAKCVIMKPNTLWAFHHLRCTTQYRFPLYQGNRDNCLQTTIDSVSPF